MPRRASDDYPEFNKFIAGLLFVYVASFFLQLGLRIEILGAIRIEMLVAASLIILSFAYKPGFKPPSKSISPYLWFFVACVVVQVIFSIKFDLSWNIFVERFIKFSVMAIFIARFVNSPAMLWVFLAAFLLACLKMGQEGFIGKVTGNMIWENQGVMRLRGSTPNYLHPNSYAGMAMGTLPFVYYLYPVVHKYIRWGLILLALLSLNIIVFTASRTAYVGFIGMAFWIFIHSDNKKQLFKLGLLGLVPLMFLVPPDYVERFMSIFTGEEKEGASSDARLLILEQAFQVFFMHPFGVGVGAFPAARMNYFGMKQDTHNLYLEVATNLGVQGLIAFLLLVVVMLKSYKKLNDGFQKTLDTLKTLLDKPVVENEAGLKKLQDEVKLFQAVGNAVVTYIFIRLVLGLFGHDIYEIYWWIGIGFVYALTNISSIVDKKMKKLMEPPATAQAM